MKIIKNDPLFHIGDRVFGYWNNIPFIGSVLNDNIIDDRGPRVSVFLDLPLLDKTEHKRIVFVKQNDIKHLIEIKI